MTGALRRGFLNLLFKVEEPPQRVALAFAVGVWIAFFPIVGIHTLVALGAAFAFRLNKVAVLLGTWVSNPWTLAPMMTCGTLLGCAVVGVSPAAIEAIDWGSFSLATYFEGLRPLLLPYVVGNLMLGTAASVLAFFVIRLLLLRRQRGQALPID